MTALQQIIKEAQSIRRKSPKMEWKKAVAQASAIYASKHKGKSPVGKKKAIKKTATKKAVGKYVKTVRKGKITDVIYKRKKIGAVKKSATTMHKDTKSHNVRISVMSGISKNFKKFIQYKKHIIDVTETASGKKMYYASTNKLAPAFCTDQLNIAKKFIDRQIAIDRIKKNNK
jgi:hypothetical protein